MSKQHAEVIDLLASGLNSHAMVREYAKRHPKSFIAAAKDVKRQETSILSRTELVEQVCASRNKVEGIKLYRTLTGAGLKEAVDEVNLMKDWSE